MRVEHSMVDRLADLVGLADDAVTQECGYALLVDHSLFEEGMVNGLSDFDADLLSLLRDDIEEMWRLSEVAQIAKRPMQEGSDTSGYEYTVSNIDYSRPIDYQAAQDALSHHKVVRHAFGSRKVALYHLVEQRAAVLSGEATLDSLAPYARQFDNANAAYKAAHVAALGFCLEHRQWVEWRNNPPSASDF